MGGMPSDAGVTDGGCGPLERGGSQGADTFLVYICISVEGQG